MTSSFHIKALEYKNLISKNLQKELDANLSPLINSRPGDVVGLCLYTTHRAREEAIFHPIQMLIVKTESGYNSCQWASLKEDNIAKVRSATAIIDAWIAILTEKKISAHERVSSLPYLEEIQTAATTINKLFWRNKPIALDFTPYPGKP